MTNLPIAFTGRSKLHECAIPENARPFFPNGLAEIPNWSRWPILTDRAETEHDLRHANTLHFYGLQRRLESRRSCLTLWREPALFGVFKNELLSLSP